MGDGEELVDGGPIGRSERRVGGADAIDEEPVALVGRDPTGAGVGLDEAGEVRAAVLTPLAEAAAAAHETLAAKAAATRVEFFTMARERT